MADDELDDLYWAEPDAFTAQRSRLAAEAKGRGDAAAAKRISAARKPTTAAWMVNRVALGHEDTKKRLADLGDRLRAAHAAMDGERIRALSAEQHKVIDRLVRAAFEAADVKQPAASVREDVTSTLQAAVAAPAVRERLGRLAKPERWSGFGALGDATEAEPKQSRPAHDTAAQRRRGNVCRAGGAPAAEKVDRRRRRRRAGPGRSPRHPVPAASRTRCGPAAA